MKCHFNVVSSIYTAAQFLIFEKCICSFFLVKNKLFSNFELFSVYRNNYLYIYCWVWSNKNVNVVISWTFCQKNSVHTFYCEWHLWDWFAPSQSNATIRLEFQHSGMCNVYGAFISFDCISHAKRLWLP